MILVNGNLVQYLMRMEKVSHRGVMVKVLDYRLEVSEFEL